jgi:glycine C-acetyltransferase
MPTTTPLARLLEDRTSGRVFRIFSEYVKTVPNSYCRVDAMDHRECVIGGRRLLNFNAINYLGLETHPLMIRAAQEALGRWGTLAGSARAAAEMSLYEQVEERVCRYLGVDNAIVYTTVTLANHGVIPLLMRKNSLVLMDWEVHSSVQRAAIEAKGAGATLLSFTHDDFAQLEDMLRANRGKHEHALIALDGVYSMLGTYLDLPRYEELAAKYDTALFIDDAHGFGVVGPGGRGIVAHYNRGYENTIYVASLEKSLASLGGFVVVPRWARDYFRYNSYTYIFSGQMPASCLAGTLAAFDILEREGERRLERLRGLIGFVKHELAAMGFETIGEDQPFPLILVKVGDVYSAPKISQYFFDEGIHILTVGFPVVPLSRGAMVRISLSASHTDTQVERLLAAFRKLKQTLAAPAPAVAVPHVPLGSSAGPVAQG